MNLNQTDFLTALGWAVINSLWQFTLLWVVYQLYITFRPKTQATTKSALASGMLITGFIWFLLTLFSIYGRQSAPMAGAVPYLYGPTGWNHWISDIVPTASSIYLLLLTIPVYRFVRNYRFVQIIRTRGIQKADVRWRLFVQKLSATMGIRKKVEVWVSELVQSPVTIGFVRPVILLPVAAINHLSCDQVEAILLHELAHIRRFDYLLNLVVRFIQCLLYFNPFVKAFVRIVETERETSCDELVMQFQYDPHGYASALLTIEKATGVTPQNLIVAANGARKGQLLNRIENIMGIRRHSPMTFRKLAGIMCTVACLAMIHLTLQWKNPGKAGASYKYKTYTYPQVVMKGATKPVSNIPAERQDQYFDTDAANKENFVSAEPHPESTGYETSESDDINLNDYAFENDTNEEEAGSVDLSFVSERENVLTPEQEAEVRKAIAASKRVFSEAQWKAIEKSVADAMSTSEKKLLRERVQVEAEKANLEAMEARMKAAYGEIDWRSLNAELEAAVKQIRLDSLQQVYSNALVNLNELEKELRTSNIHSIPDSDISLKSISEKRANLEKLIHQLNAAKERKTIKL